MAKLQTKKIMMVLMIFILSFLCVVPYCDFTLTFGMMESL